MTFMELQDNAQQLARLRIVLLALLPKTGEPRTVAELAASAYTDKQSVSDALFDDYMDGRIGFDVVTDSFHDKRQGSAL
ncbi:hypothetical protein [Hydrogenophaga taeniospiralis]|uniref:hypothetical protein n=1 Tax=Hydrogenophaga taeniospiralis TaxID=65656 RepID=UPI001CF9D839|nr:hypothetical protein [Hydrogenophaga taeniospiralis]UCU92666.1 hypothetical protein KI616_17755 [Hydrogenophaga taeniospiralis]